MKARHLPLLLAAYRSTPHSATKYSPNRLMLGREVYQPQDLLFGSPPVSRKTESLPSYVAQLSNEMEKAHETARKNLKTAQLKQKKLHDMNLLKTQYYVGDLVYVLEFVKTYWKMSQVTEH